MILNRNTKFHFGKYKGRDIKNVIQLDHEYIYWIIRKFDNLLIHPDFLQYAYRVNPDFGIDESITENYSTAINNYLIRDLMADVEDSIFQSLVNHFENGSYLKIPKLSAKEKLEIEKELEQSKDDFIKTLKEEKLNPKPSLPELNNDLSINEIESFDCDDDWLIGASGIDDPEIMSDVYWNLD